jgi:hypothetical protein
MHQEQQDMAEATRQIEALDQSQLRQAKTTIYKLQRQVEEVMALPGYKDL